MSRHPHHSDHQHQQQNHSPSQPKQLDYQLDYLDSQSTARDSQSSTSTSSRPIINRQSSARCLYSSSDLSSSEDPPWSLVPSPTSSSSHQVPSPTSRLGSNHGLTSSSGSQLSPRAIAIEELNDNNSSDNDDEVIVASSVEEPPDDDYEQQQSGAIITKFDTGVSQSIGTTTPTITSTSNNPFPTSFLFRQPLLVNTSSHIKASLSRIASTATAPTDTLTPHHPHQPISSLTPHQPISSSFVNHHSSEQVSVVRQSASISDSGVAFRRAEEFKRSNVTQSTPTATHQTSASQFVGAYSHSLHSPPSSSPPGYYMSKSPPDLSSNPLHHHHPNFQSTHPQALQSSQYPTSMIPVASHPQQQQLSTQLSPYHYPSSLAPSSGQVARPAYDSVSAPPNQREMAYAAYTKGITDAARLQMMTTAQFASRPSIHQPPIIIQNTTKAVAESQQTTESKLSPPPPRRSVFDNWVELIHNFWSSKLNRVLLVGLTGAGLYLYWEWWQHNRRLQLMQRRIEANPLLRLGQIISGAADGQRGRTHNNSGGGYY